VPREKQLLVAIHFLSGTEMTYRLDVS
jgi:hypothetical protein